MKQKRLKYIRETVFKENQTQFAAMLGISQPTYSDFEKRDSLPFIHQQTVRKVATERDDIDWQDSWFFEAPEEAA